MMISPLHLPHPPPPIGGGEGPPLPWLILPILRGPPGPGLYNITCYHGNITNITNPCPLLLDELVEESPFPGLTSVLKLNK